MEEEITTGLEEELEPAEDMNAEEHDANIEEALDIGDDEFSAMIGSRDYESTADIEQIWMREIGAVPLLSNKEVVELARKVEEGEVLSEVDYAFTKDHGRAPDGPSTVIELLRRIIGLDRIAAVMARHAGVNGKKGLLATVTDPAFAALSDAVYTRELIDDLVPLAGNRAEVEHAVRELSVARRLLPTKS